MCSKSVVLRGFLRSRLQLLARSSLAGTLHERSLSDRFVHHAKHGWNSSNLNL